MTGALKNTFTVWHALFLREVLDRFFGSRAGWAWLVFEPASHILVMGIMYSVLRGVMPGNIDTFIWITVGMLGFFLFRRTGVQAQHAVDCNKAFFAFRQVRPFDAVLARSSVEAFSMFFVSLGILLPLCFFDKNIVPKDPLLLMISMGSLWMLGLGYGMICAVIQRLIPESAHIIGLLYFPLYLLSGALMPLSVLPAPYLKLLMYNPLAHALDYCRYAFIDHYRVLPGADLSYVFIWVIGLLFIGLCLFKLFETRLVMR